MKIQPKPRRRYQLSLVEFGLLVGIAQLLIFHVWMAWWYWQGCPGGRSPQWVVDAIDLLLR
jgi:hypothetical protein